MNPHLAFSRRIDPTCLNFVTVLWVSGAFCCLEGVLRVSGGNLWDV